QIETAKVDAIDITNPGGQLRLRHAGASEPWKLYAGSTPPRIADSRAVQDLLTLLTTKRQIRSFPDAKKSDADLGLDKPAAEISVWVEGVKPEEKKEEKEAKPEEKKAEKPADKKDEKSQPAWKIKQPKHLAERQADAFAVENIIASLRSLQTEKLVAEKASAAELDRYGLKSPDFKATVTLKLKDGKTEDRTFLVGKVTEDKANPYGKLGNS